MAKLKNPGQAFDPQNWDKEYGDHPYTQEWYGQNDPGYVPGVTPGPAPQQQPPQQGPQGGGGSNLSREQWRDNWLRQGRMTSAEMDAWMAQNGATKMGENGTFRTPHGEVLDLGIGYKTGTVTPGWTRTDGGGPGGGGPGGTGPGSAGGPGGVGGANPYSPQAWEAIMGVLKQGWGADQGGVARRFEGARENLERGRNSQIDSLRAQLAERGLLGSGPEATGYGRIESNLQGGFNTALRDAYSAESELASNRYMDALGQAVRMSEGENSRQLGLGQLALGQLSENRQWNQFMAQFGLDREKFMHDVENGNTDQYLRLIDLFLRYGAGTSEGYR